MPNSINNQYQITDRQIKIAVIASNNVEDMEFIIPIDLWRRAGYIVDVIGIETKNNFSLKYSSLKVNTLYNLKHTNLIQYDAIYLPGGGVNKGYLTPPSSYKTPGEPKLHSAIRKFFDSTDKLIISICGAPLALLTILGHERALKVQFTSHPRVEVFEEYRGNRLDQKIVQCNNVITGMHAGCSIDLGIYVIRALSGDQIADDIAKDLEF